MKLKKIYMTSICYLTLVAFISIISVEVSCSGFHRLKTEVSANKSGINREINLVFEVTFIQIGQVGHGI